MKDFINDLKLPKRLHTHSIISHILLITFLICGITIITFHVLSPSLFFHIMKGHMVQQAEDMVLTSALRQSYIWQSNFRLRILSSDSDFEKLLEEYYEEGSNKEQIRNSILSYLPLLQQGTPVSDASSSVTVARSSGSILFHDYLILLEKDGNFFCAPEAVPIARVLQNLIIWPDSLPQERIINHLAPFTLPDDDTEYFPTIETFALDQRCYTAVRVTPLKDILTQFKELQAFGADDYIICCHDQVLYSHLDRESSICLTDYPDSMFSDDQYSVVSYRHDRQTDFSVLVTYPQEDLRIFVSIPDEVMLAPYQQIFTCFRLILSGFALLLFFVFSFTLRHALRRLTNLEKEMNRVRSGDYNVQISDSTNDEIGSLTQTFQIMLEQLRSDMECQEKMQYTLLVSAIDPHFLYNTLNTVTALAELGRVSEISRVNTALIGTLKDRLKMKNYKIFDTVQAEKDALDQYMVIQSYLTYVKIEYSFSVSENDLEVLIPKNIIQPLVENSIKHGILGRDYPEDDDIKCGKIEVHVSRQENQILISVYDNGVGMSPEIYQKYFASDPDISRHLDENMEHIGIFNVLMRLDYLYRKNYKIHVENNYGEGLCIELLLPDSVECV